MALFGDAVMEEVTRVLTNRYQALGKALGENVASEMPTRPAEHSPLRRDLDLLIGAANGVYPRTDANVRRVELALDRTLDLLLGNALGSSPRWPEGFWRTDLGVMVSRLRYWVSAEDLITISNAAALAFGANTQANRMRIARAMDNGQLDWVPDPTVANPHQNRRVLRSQVERLRDLSSLPGVE